MISARTKAALAQAKARGVKLGGHRPGGPKVDGRLGAEANSKLAQERADMLGPVMAEMKAQCQ